MLFVPSTCLRLYLLFIYFQGQERNSEEVLFCFQPSSLPKVMSDSVPRFGTGPNQWKGFMVFLAFSKAESKLKENSLYFQNSHSHFYFCYSFQITWEGLEAACCFIVLDFGEGGCIKSLFLSSPKPNKKFDLLIFSVWTRRHMGSSISANLVWAFGYQTLFGESPICIPS